MILHSKIVGEEDKIIVILHGLFGSGDNWKTYANKLVSQGFCIHLIDQRNHGRSFHTDEFNYELLVIDLKNYLDQNNINDCILMGHSMGGKTAMNFALKYSEYVSRLIVLDIAPKYYPVHHNKILEALTPSEKIEANRSKSEFNDPYMGGKEIIVKRFDESGIAVALLSEVKADGDEWAIYREI